METYWSSHLFGYFCFFLENFFSSIITDFFIHGFVAIQQTNWQQFYVVQLFEQYPFEAYPIFIFLIILAIEDLVYFNRPGSGDISPTENPHSILFVIGNAIYFALIAVVIFAIAVISSVQFQIFPSFGAIFIPPSIGTPLLHPTPTPIPPIDITGVWSGCIQGYQGPNEAITLDITGEKSNGLLTGIYGENFWYYLGISNQTISGHWDITNSHIYLDQHVYFVTNIIRNNSVVVISSQTPLTYTFTGSVNTSAGVRSTLSGTVSENDGTNQQNHAWSLTQNGGCPY